MKKKILWLFLLLFPIMIANASVNYDITNFLIDANVLENGDLKVKELIVLKGNFNGYVRELRYKNLKTKAYDGEKIDFSDSAFYNANGISNVELATKKITTEEVNFDLLNEVFTPMRLAQNNQTSKNGYYTFQEVEGGADYKMYQSAQNETVAFLISYIVDEAVVMHNDVAELYWTFIGDAFTDEISNLKIQLHFPDREYKTFYFWAHGDINGESDRIANDTILATMTTLNKNSTIDLRAIFDKETIKNSEKLRHSNQDAFDEIWKIEEERTERVNNQRKLIRFIVDFSKVTTIIYYITILVLWIFIYFKFDKEYKSTFNAEYYREFTGDYNVEVIDYLMNKNITPNAMSASIMNLIYKKNIEVTEEPSKKKKKIYRFTLKNNQNVTDTEQVLLDFLFEEVGKNQTFTTEELEKYASSTKTGEVFARRYTSWKNCVKKDAEREKFYEVNGIPTVIGILMLLIGILLFLVAIYYQINYIPSYFIFPVGIIFLFYTIIIKKKTKKGQEHYVRWKAFKNFLKDFGNFEVKELPEISLWEKYLVYATVFGLADEVEKSMNVKISEFSNEVSTYEVWTPMINLQISHAINTSIQNAYHSSISAAAAVNSKASTNGFGGGFSGGAGFGGGGGGGHGF